MKKIICISGDLGSGKSTVGRLIAKMLGYEYYSAGMIFRQLAEKTGRNVLELNKLSEIDASIDDMIDSTIAEIGENREMVILDSRLAWYFVKEAFNVYLTIKTDEAAKRIMNAKRGVSESYCCIEEAVKRLGQRRETEVRRYKSKYNADIRNMANYHLIIDTTSMSPEKVANTIIEGYEGYLTGDSAGEGQDRLS